MLKPLRTIILALAAAAALGAIEAAAAELAGTVSRVRGEATALAGGQTRPLTEKAKVYVGDEIRTGRDTRVEVTMIDDTKLTLGDNSRLAIDEYVFSSKQNKGKGSVRVIEGVFRAATGKLSKVEGAPFQVKMPVATLGIRGTEFWGEQRADNLLVALLGGKGVYLENQAGRVEINQLGFATRITSATTAPAAPFKLTEEEMRAALATVAW
ncbi:MAG: FecR family protein [Alphaproteobacteria bacterium]